MADRKGFVASRLSRLSTRSRLVLLNLVVLPPALVIGPMIGLRHFLLCQLFGNGLVAGGLQTPAWSWARLERGRTNSQAVGPAGFFLGLLVGIGLMFTSYGMAERWYVDTFTSPRTVLVTKEDCHPGKESCAPFDRLATLDGRPLANLEDPPAAWLTGKQIVVRWDRLGYASPTMINFPDGSLPIAAPGSDRSPVWFLLMLVVLAAGTGWFAVRGGRLPPPYQRPERLPPWSRPPVR
jgi:hypothetical protein